MDLSLNHKDNYNLPIYANLESLNKNKIYSSLHHVKFRHPADIFFNRFKDIVICLNNLKPLLNSDGLNEESISLIKQYLLSIDSFYDNLYNIIVCLKKPNDIKMKTATQWLKDSGHSEGTKLTGSTLNHHKYISVPVNKIKHDDPEINGISLTWENGPQVKGFFINSILEGDLVASDSKIHNNYCGLSTGFSFNNFLLKTVGLVYFYSYELNRILFSNSKKYSNKKLSEFYALAEFATNVDIAFYPDEYTTPVGSFKKEKNRTLIKYPFKYKNKKPKKDEWKINSYISINQRTSQANVKIPYFGEKNKITN